jgi:aminomethyltransferase
MKETPLFQIHKKMNAKFVNFNGWNMPVWFKDLKEEHLHVRRALGVFDVSHMGELEVIGKNAESFIDFTFTNTILNLKDSQARYCFLFREDGGVIDDVIIYRLNQERFFICVNAGNIVNVFNWLDSLSSDFGVMIKNLSDFYGQLAIQGPRAVESIIKLFPNSNIDKINKYSIQKIFELDKQYESRLSSPCPDGYNFLIARTGYTGEDGFELFVPNEALKEIYSQILDQVDNVQPCGLGCRDTLRLEKGFPLHGNELSERLNPIEANLEKFIDFSKENFIGRESLDRIFKNRNFTLIGFKMEEKSIPRAGYKIFSKDQEIGHVTSGTFSPVLQEGIGLGLIKNNCSELNDIQVKIRNDKKSAKKVRYPFV